MKTDLRTRQTDSSSFRPPFFRNPKFFGLTQQMVKIDPSDVFSGSSPPHLKFDMCCFEIVIVCVNWAGRGWFWCPLFPSASLCWAVVLLSEHWCAALPLLGITSFCAIDWIWSHYLVIYTWIFQASTLRLYLTCIRNTLEAAMCLQV